MFLPKPAQLIVDFPTPIVNFLTKMVALLQNDVVAKTFAPKFRSEPSDREVHSSHGDYFRDHFYVYVSGQFLGHLWATLICYQQFSMEY